MFALYLMKLQSAITIFGGDDDADADADANDDDC
jgi:hypothetical protein